MCRALVVGSWKVNLSLGFEKKVWQMDLSLQSSGETSERKQSSWTASVEAAELFWSLGAIRPECQPLFRICQRGRDYRETWGLPVEPYLSLANGKWMPRLLWSLSTVLNVGRSMDKLLHEYLGNCSFNKQAKSVLSGLTCEPFGWYSACLMKVWW